MLNILLKFTRPSSDQKDLEGGMRFTGVLRKTIDLDDAPARGLNCTSLPSAEEDRLVYEVEQVLARVDALDRHCNIAPNTPDICLARAKALLSEVYKIDVSNPKFWLELSMELRNMEHLENGPMSD
jgi:hypothetical protein